jgi:hypothetical protein
MFKLILFQVNYIPISRILKSLNSDYYSHINFEADVPQFYKQSIASALLFASTYTSEKLFKK